MGKEVCKHVIVSLKIHKFNLLWFFMFWINKKVDNQPDWQQVQF